jgi:phospholipid/cholesterol/gamma-HCH transport system ATP-binding protein
MFATESTRERSSEPLIELRAVDVQFGRQQVLREITLVVPRGQTVAIIGESGCGKTVTLKLCIGLIRPTQGEVFFAGQNMNELTEHQLAIERVRFGFVFQGAALFDSMTIAENIAFPLKQHTDKSRAEIAEIVHGRLVEVGLPDGVAKKKPVELSGGMRKRVGLARALAMNPEVVLYDEPTTGLDPIMSDVINELIIRTRERYPVTSLVVTHDMTTARKVADRVVMLFPLSRSKPGQPQMIFDGPPRDLERSTDRRVVQFVKGEAGERLMETQDIGGQNPRGRSRR